MVYGKITPDEEANNTSERDALNIDGGVTSLNMSKDEDVKRLELLMRTVQSKVDVHKQSTGKELVCSYSLLYSRTSGAERCKMFTGWFIAAIAGTLTPATIYMFGEVFDTLNIQDKANPDYDELVHTMRWVFIAFSSLGLAVWITITLYNALLISFSKKAAVDIKSAYLQAILQQDCTWFDTINQAELGAKIGSEVTMIESALGDKMGNFIYTMFMGISGIALGFARGWEITLAIMTFGIIMVPVAGFWGYSLQVGTSTVLKGYGQSAGYAEQALSAIRLVAAFGMEEAEAKNYSRYLHLAKDASLKINVVSSFGLSLVLLCIYLLYGYAFWIGSYFIERGYYNGLYGRAYSAGDVISIFFVVITGLFSVGGLGQNAKSITGGRVAGKLAFDVINRKPTIDQDKNSGSTTKIEGVIEFKGVDFFYPTRPDTKVLTNFSTKFELGKTTAIVGPSGSGKSTIVQLVERFYDPNQGQVLIDGADIKEIHLRSLRQQIGYVSQEPILFNTTIKRNILFGKPDATDDEIIDALKKTNAWDFVSKYEKGIDTMVGASGSQLSGGEKQRIALARAFVKKPRVLIFDEATSALDKKNEADVQRAIEKMKSELGSVTSIVIAHRMTTIRNADNIIVMEKGKVTEEGDHASLLAQYPEGLYARLTQEQAKADIGLDNMQLETSNANESAVKDLDLSSNSKAEDAAAEKKLEEALEKDVKEKEELATELDSVQNSNKQFQTFLKRLNTYNQPVINVIIGSICNIAMGLTLPFLGLALSLTLFAMMIEDLEEMREAVNAYVLYFIYIAIVCFFGNFFSKLSFMFVGENITLNMRKETYFKILSKHIGWHDNRENASGILTGVLAKDAAALNGASLEGLSIIIESIAAISAGLVAGFLLSWQTGLVALCVFPLLVVGGSLEGEGQKRSFQEGESTNRNADLLASDSIQNYKTLQSFGSDQTILKEYQESLAGPYKEELKQGIMHGLLTGLSQFLQNFAFGLLFWLATLLIRRFDGVNPDNAMGAVFLISFGAFSAGQAQQFGPDLAKGQAAATKIFTIMDTPSKINACDEAENEKKVSLQRLEGTIEFKNVWFRYPTRPKEWIFKGLNLTINKDDSIAVVGESGQGKSTMINLIMRFYDPDFGQVLIDNIDVKDYDVRSLRRCMGLVMQEPTLFNTTIKENILYGNQTASNEEIDSAVKVSNAAEFIESSELEKAFDDNASSLLDVYAGANLKSDIIKKSDEETYDSNVKVLTLLAAKEKKEGSFSAVKGELDIRTEKEIGQHKLHVGYDISCGNRGSKLSGGQKQRVAITRAILRNPSILLLDEATSALDEESQTKVQAALDTAMMGRTSIVVAHRLTTVEKCNRIAVLEDGQIIEEGSYGSLASKENGHFQKLAQGMNRKSK